MSVINRIKVWYRLRKIASVQNIFESSSMEYMDLSGVVSEEEKAIFITSSAGGSARYLLLIFKTFGLKTHIDQMIRDEATGEEYILTFRKVDKTKPNWNLDLPVHVPSKDEIEHIARQEKEWDYASFCQGFVRALQYFNLLEK